MFVVLSCLSWMASCILLMLSSRPDNYRDNQNAWSTSRKGRIQADQREAAVTSGQHTWMLTNPYTAGG